MTRSEPSHLEDLVGQATSGEARAIEELLERYLPGLQRYVRQRAGDLVGGRDESVDLAQSVAREVLEGLASRRLRYQGEAQFKSWLYRAAMLKIVGRYRYYRAGKRDVLKEVSPVGPGGSDDEGVAREALFRTLRTPSQEAMLREDLARFESAFAELPDTYRQVMVLAHLEGLTHGEIAERLGISEGHSRVLLSRARARLATLSSRG